MPKDIRARIKADAIAGAAERLSSEWKDAQLCFDRLIPRTSMERLADEALRPAFYEFAALNEVSRWWCRVFDVWDMQVPFDVSRQIGSYFPQGLLIRFSSIFGGVRVPYLDDPYCAFLYNDVSQRAYLASALWGSDPVVDPLECKDLTVDRLLELLHAFSEKLRRWENKNPPATVGFEPYPRYGLAVGTLG